MRRQRENSGTKTRGRKRNLMAQSRIYGSRSSVVAGETPAPVRHRRDPQWFDWPTTRSSLSPIPCQLTGRKAADQIGTADSPIQTLDLISKDCAFHRQASRNENFKWISFDLASDRAKESKANLGIVLGRGEHERGPPAGLLVARLRIQADPNDVSPFRNERRPALPRLLANGGPSVDLAMDILRSHSREEQIQGI